MFCFPSAILVGSIQNTNKNGTFVRNYKTQNLCVAIILLNQAKEILLAKVAVSTNHKVQQLLCQLIQFSMQTVSTFLAKTKSNYVKPY